MEGEGAGRVADGKVEACLAVEMVLTRSRFSASDFEHMTSEVTTEVSQASFTDQPPSCDLDRAALAKNRTTWASTCVFVGYKYWGGGHRVCDGRRSNVVESTFYGLAATHRCPPLPMYHELTTQADDANGSVLAGCVMACQRSC